MHSPLKVLQLQQSLRKKERKSILITFQDLLAKNNKIILSAQSVESYLTKWLYSHNH